GNNHEGNYSLAEEMIGKAAECGVHAVKFQTIVPEKFICSKDTKRIEQLKKYQLTYDEFRKLANYAKNAGLIFISTPFDLETVDFLDEIVPAYKIASCDNTFLPLIRKIASKNKPVIISTGLSDMTELKPGLDIFRDAWGEELFLERLAILHCVSNYPVSPENANLLSIKYMKDIFKCTIGYSDHTLGIDACMFAVAMGAGLIEKHFTIDKNYSAFRDHQLSANPSEMKALVEKIKLFELMQGSYDLKMQDSEKEIKPLIKRSLAANKDLLQGHKISINDIMWVRPGTGIPPGNEDQVIEKTVKNEIKYGELILLEDLN
ncbi:MAG: hypothetical protein ACD_79C00262G0003, partial [uncultured bacterium]